jgi:hypothetical protein
MDTKARSFRRWGWLLAFPWSVGLLMTVYNVVNNNEISEREQVSDATVVAYHPENHMMYDLRINVGSKTYVGQDRPDAGNLAINEGVRVFFDPQNPKKMSLTSFSDRGSELLGQVPILVLGLAAVLAFWAFQRRRRPKSGEGQS